MIVEDNDEVRNYVEGLLSGWYHIETAANGKEGYKLAKDKPVDFILSDITMPEYDGFELCRRVKNDVKTCHIPFVMVTARTDVGSKLKGYELGIDSYLLKPFNEKELLLIVKNLLEKRKEQMNYFGHLLELKSNKTKEIDTHALDVEFIKNVQEYALDVTHKMFVDELAKKLGTSRTQLHRKITALTGMSTTKYVNHVRLVKAKNLLTSTTLTISEIAYEVGFEDAQYFSKVFKSNMNLSPTEYKKSKA